MTPLDRIPNFPPKGRLKLDTYGIHTAEGFLSLTLLHDTRSCLKKLLRVSELDLKKIIEQTTHHLPDSCGELQPTPIEPYMLGLAASGRSIVADSKINTFAAKRSWFSPQLTTEISLVPRLPPVRNQGRRGTCVAFAVTSAFEYEFQKSNRFWIKLAKALGLQKKSEAHLQFAPQFLYWACKARDGYNGPGTYIHTAMECLRESGCCPETIWPYNPEQLDGNEGQGPPPKFAQYYARKHLADSSSRLHIPDIKKQIVLNNLIVFGVPVFPSWGNIETLKTGRIPMPLPGEPSVGGHALSLCGFRDDPNAPGGGWFIFRNSWGTHWASENPDGQGYGLLPYAYMDRYGRDFHSLKLKIPQTLVSKNQLKKVAQTIPKFAASLAAGLLIGTSVIAGITFFKTVLVNPPKPVIVKKQKMITQSKVTEENRPSPPKVVPVKDLFQTYQSIWDEMNEVR